MGNPELYLHVGKAKHFARWERPEFAKHFTLVDAPADNVPLLSFGPDVFDEAAMMPASRRYAVLFPGFSFNPVRDEALRLHQRGLMASRFERVFINPGPLTIAYQGVANVSLFPFSVDLELAKVRGYRRRLDSLIHVSQDNPQKDWRRSESIMHRTGLKYEVFPPRQSRKLVSHVQRVERANAFRRALRLRERGHLPVGYLSHEATVRKYQDYDGFVHVARDVRHPEFIDGMFTASLIEAGATGAILFWHDTWQLGSELETPFRLPLDTRAAAEIILDIRSSIDVEKHSRATSDEMLEVFNPRRSVAIRAESILADA